MTTTNTAESFIINAIRAIRAEASRDWAVGAHGCVALAEAEIQDWTAMLAHEPDLWEVLSA